MAVTPRRLVLPAPPPPLPTLRIYPRMTCLPLLDSPNQRRAARRSTLRQVSPPEEATAAGRIASTFDAANAKSSGGGSWMGPKPAPTKGGKSKSQRLRDLRLRELHELLNELGYKYISWDGKHPLLILDREGRIITVFIGAPEDPTWPSVIAEAIKALRKAREQGLKIGAFACGDDRHRRGRYYTLTGGVSHGGGQKACSTTLPTQFFLAVTFNLDPQSVTFDHVDYHNNPLGWCAITNGGDFDYKKSAQIYLDQIKVVVEFPSGASNLVPSAIIRHGNTPLAPGETCYSITQYAAGGLFRYVKYGFKTAKQLLAQKGGRQMKAALDGAPGERASWGLGLYSKEDELVTDHATAFGSK
ncbi:hypothetical protein DFH09DRAFT_1498180 [Mycena vulgaris]|nr:hypothetical protein DFH09DRAFT_1498180 [Mycena vulgaris]